MKKLKRLYFRFYVPLATFVIMAGSYFLRYAVNVFIARILGPALFGDYIITLRLVLILSNVALVGTNITSSRYLPLYYKERNFRSAADYFRWNIALVGISFLICLIVAILAILAMYLLHYFNVKDIQEYYMPVYSLWIVPIVALFLLLSSLLLAQNYNLSSAFFKNILNLVLIFICFYFFYYWLGIKVSNINIIVILGSVFLFIAILQFIILMIQNKGFFRMMSLIFRSKNIRIVNRWFTFSYRIVISNIAYYLLSIIDLLIVEIIVPSEAAVGYYAAVLTITLFIWMVPNALYRFIKPAISGNLDSKEDRMKLQRYLKEINILNLVLSLLVTIIIFVFALHFLHYFGEGYEVGERALLIAASGFFIGTFAKSPILLLIYAGYERLLIYVTLTELTLLLVLGSLFAYYWGINGVATATFIAITVKTIMAYLFSKSKIKIEPWAFL